ncbi:MAG: radical SAM protein [Candidatus Altiarchaeota archaeon]
MQQMCGVVLVETDSLQFLGKYTKKRIKQMTENKRVALISPDWLDIANPYPPLGLVYIAAVLEANEFELKIFDLSLHPGKKIELKIQEILAFDPTIAGITCMTNTYSNALKIAGELKKRTDIKIFLGGPHPTVYTEDTLKNPEVDYVVFGEGEETIFELLKSSFQKNEDIEGLAYKKDGIIYINPARPPIKNLDELPNPARHLLELESYSLASPGGEKMASIMSSRGCPYGCTYCFKGLFGSEYRGRSPENIFHELTELRDRFGYKYFYFIDDLFTLKKERVRQLCNLLVQNKTNIHWQCLARVDSLDLELLSKMKEAGCFKIHLGIESGNTEVLKKTGKGITLKQVKDTVKSCKKAGIATKGYFMLGLPGDTEKTMRETIDFAYELDLDESMFSITTPFPGTQLWENSTEAEKIRLADHFKDSYYFSSADDSTILSNMSEETDEKLLGMLELSHEMQLKQRLERKYGGTLGPIINKTIKIYPIRSLLRSFFGARNELRERIRENPSYL